MSGDFTSPKEDALEAENIGLRQLLAQAGIDASRLLAQAGIDATEQEAATRLQRLLLEELHHRVKNTLATVMAITSQSLQNATNMEQGRESIAHRLIALGRAHDLLLQTNWTSASLPAIVRAAIESFDTVGAERFVVQGAEIEVGPAAVLSLAMALNELCTNAVKYGALSNAQGRVEITSVLDEKAQRFKLIWEEKGGPPVKPPSRRSFGTKLIEHSLARLLHGDARLRFEPAGVICEFDFPLASLRAIPK
jgi:two-component sensor histidine kinase